MNSKALENEPCWGRVRDTEISLYGAFAIFIDTIRPHFYKPGIACSSSAQVFFNAADVKMNDESNGIPLPRREALQM